MHVSLLICGIWFFCTCSFVEKNLRKVTEEETNSLHISMPEEEFLMIIFSFSFMVMETGPSSQRDRLLQVAADHQSAYSSLSQHPGHQVESGCAAASISGSESCESSVFCLLTEDALSPLSLYGPLLPTSLPLFVSPTTALFGGSVFLWNLGNNLCLLDKTTNVFAILLL